MSLRRMVADHPINTPFVDHEVQPGEEVETPDYQPDGSPLLWPSDYWVDATTAAAKVDTTKGGKTAPNAKE